MNNKPKAGDIVRVIRYYWEEPEVVEYKLEEFHHCLGFFETRDDKIASNFTPLSSLIRPAPDSEKLYIPNYGAYNSKYIANYDIIKTNVYQDNLGLPTEFIDDCLESKKENKFDYLYNTRK